MGGRPDVPPPFLRVPCVAKTPQAYGAALTYARRYGFQAMICQAAEDDDGNAASGKDAKTRTAKADDPLISVEALAITAAAAKATTADDVEALRPRYEALKGTPEFARVGTALAKRKQEVQAKS